MRGEVEGKKGGVAKTKTIECPHCLREILYDPREEGMLLCPCCGNEIGSHGAYGSLDFSREEECV